MTAKEQTELAVELPLVGSTDRPDDPLAARDQTSDAVMAGPAAVPDDSHKPTPPTPDQEGCYYLG